MSDLLKENIGSVEMGFRFMLGVALIAATMTGVGLTAWVSLFAVYPIVTAFMAWDPVYALAHIITAKAKTLFPHKPTALPAS